MKSLAGRIKRLQRRASTFAGRKAPRHPWDEEFELISHQDAPAIALREEADAIAHDAVKDHPDREALHGDPPRLYAAMDTPSLERLRDCVEALHARMDLLRKNPCEPAEPEVKRGTRRKGHGQTGSGNGA